MSLSHWDRLLLRPALSATTTPPTRQSSIPVFLYGTAWKKDSTADLVYKALCNGFRGIDTAAQPKHYREELVGEGLRRAIGEGKVGRGDVFVQTKYTSVTSQDLEAGMPYDPQSSITEQIHASIASSLRNLRASDDNENEAENTYLDALVLHSPLPTMTETLEAWRALETYVPHKIRNLGISNCRLPVLKSLCETARVKPSVVQNRFYPKADFDGEMRGFCREQGIVYEAFWVLTANPRLVWSAEVGVLAHQVGVSQQAALYCLVLALGRTVLLNGTGNEGRMRADLEAPGKVGEWAERFPEAWERALAGFKRLIGEEES
ncbi:hypothetical protein AJ80_03378 [Polytolypa hystricis UAMH7299]|uniref:NADP-dependent oxidoreductase domain-containing protein n=1 Tax=Polytolypa hystricis (strain UAMH7299) TaxID=1447883 RepID=A0A2B7YL44_POLH7|nr:hypothetical protein AJ80_03378 [Polytolypa hystricis UAMH7299]